MSGQKLSSVSTIKACPWARRIFYISMKRYYESMEEFLMNNALSYKNK